LVLDLLLKDEFPRIYRHSAEAREVLAQLRYRNKLVQMRTQTTNSLLALFLREGLSLKGQLRTQRGREKLLAHPLAAEQVKQRDEWLGLIEQLSNTIKRVEQDLVQLATNDVRVRRLRTHPGIGLLTGLALVHTLCPIDRFSNSRKVTAYVGLEPREFTSDTKQRWGGISKAGSPLLRFLLVEAAQQAALRDPELKSTYHRLSARRGRPRAKVAIARKLLVRAYILLRDEIDYATYLRRTVAVRSARN
jgi:transposase